MNNDTAHFISFASPKGGVGKSTSCLSIAGALLARGEKVRIIDFDQTQTIMRWYEGSPILEHLPNLTVEKAPTENLPEFIETLWQTATGYVLLDLAGSLSDFTIAVASFAAITITPAKISEPDIMEANKIALQMQSMAEHLGKPIYHLILLNEMPSSVSNDELDLIRQIDESDLQRFQTIIRRRSGFSKTFSRGTLPHFANPADPKAIAEIDALVAEIDEILAVATQKQKEAA